jgi:biotin transport system substrate-specific component
MNASTASPVSSTLAPTRAQRGLDLATIGREAAFLLAATGFLALTARISLPLPFTPVPLSGQTLGVLLVGAVYGPRRGALAVVAYVAEGLAGAPVFAAGRSGLPVLLGPTGGYIAGFIPAAAVAGLLAAAGRPFWLRLAGAALASLVVYALGVPWLGVVAGLPLGAAAVAGALPFLPGDALKALLAAAVTPAGAPLLRRLGLRPW